MRRLEAVVQAGTVDMQVGIFSCRIPPWVAHKMVSRGASKSSLAPSSESSQARSSRNEIEMSAFPSHCVSVPM